MMEAVTTSETSIKIDQTIWRYIPEDSALRTLNITNIYLFAVFG